MASRKQHIQIYLYLLLREGIKQSYTEIGMESILSLLQSKEALGYLQIKEIPRTP